MKIAQLDKDTFCDGYFVQGQNGLVFQYFKLGCTF